MTPPDHYIDRVAKGAALLDEHLPGWVDEIDLTDLILENPCFCILGQAGRLLPFSSEGAYTRALSYLESRAGYIPGRLSYDHGFDLDYDEDADGTDDSELAFSWLQEAWEALIADRVLGPA